MNRPSLGSFLLAHEPSETLPIRITHGGPPLCRHACVCLPPPLLESSPVLARLDRVVFGAHDPKFGACGSLFTITTDPRTNHQVELVAGVCETECAALLQEFFQRQRAMGKK